MNDQLAGNQPLENVLTDIPSQFLTPEAKTKLTKLCRAMDSIGRFEKQSQEVFIDEASIHKMLSDFVTPQFANHFVARMKAFPDSGKVIRQTNAASIASGNVTTIQWQNLANRVNILKPAPGVISTLKSLNLNTSTTEDELRKAVKQHYPDIPDYMFDPKELHDHLENIVNSTQAMSAENEATLSPSIPRDVWDCCVRHLGIWTVIVIVIVISAAIVALSIASGGTAAAFAGTFWFWFGWLAGAGTGLLTLVVVGNCVLDPSR